MTAASSAFRRSDGRTSWVPLWRVAGLCFVAYPLVRIVIEPPELLVAVLVLSATAAFGVLVFSLGAARAGRPRAARARPSLRSTWRSSGWPSRP